MASIPSDIREQLDPTQIGALLRVPQEVADAFFESVRQNGVQVALDTHRETLNQAYRDTLPEEDKPLGVGETAAIGVAGQVAGSVTATALGDWAIRGDESMIGRLVNGKPTADPTTGGVTGGEGGPLDTTIPGPEMQAPVPEAGTAPVQTTPTPETPLPVDTGGGQGGMATPPTAGGYPTVGIESLPAPTAGMAIGTLTSQGMYSTPAANAAFNSAAMDAAGASSGATGAQVAAETLGTSVNYLPAAVATATFAMATHNALTEFGQTNANTGQTIRNTATMAHTGAMTGAGISQLGMQPLAPFLIAGGAIIGGLIGFGATHFGSSKDEFQQQRDKLREQWQQLGLIDENFSYAGFNVGLDGGARIGSDERRVYEFAAGTEDALVDAFSGEVGAIRGQIVNDITPLNLIIGGGENSFSTYGTGMMYNMLLEGGEQGAVNREQVYEIYNRLFEGGRAEALEHMERVVEQGRIPAEQADAYVAQINAVYDNMEQGNTGSYGLTADMQTDVRQIGEEERQQIQQTAADAANYDELSRYEAELRREQGGVVGGRNRDRMREEARQLREADRATAEEAWQRGQAERLERQATGQPAPDQQSPAAQGVDPTAQTRMGGMVDQGTQPWEMQQQGMASPPPSGADVGGALERVRDIGVPDMILDDPNRRPTASSGAMVGRGAGQMTGRPQGVASATGGRAVGTAAARGVQQRPGQPVRLSGFENLNMDSPELQDLKRKYGIR